MRHIPWALSAVVLLTACDSGEPFVFTLSIADGFIDFDSEQAPALSVRVRNEGDVEVDEFFMRYSLHAAGSQVCCDDGDDLLTGAALAPGDEKTGGWPLGFDAPFDLAQVTLEVAYDQAGTRAVCEDDCARLLCAPDVENCALE